MRNILIVACLLALSLYGYSIINVVIALVLLLIICSIYARELARGPFIFITLVLIYLGVDAIYMVVITPDWSIEKATGSAINNYWQFCVFGMILVFMCNLREVLKDVELEGALQTLIWLHLFFFLAQFVLYYFAGYLIDFSQVLFGHEGRNMYGSTFRATGLLPEPSTYAGVLCCLLVPYYTYIRKFNLTLATAILTFLLSLSTAAWVLAVFFVLAFFLLSEHYSYSSKIKYLSVVFIIISSLSLVFSDYVLLQSVKYEDTSPMRILLVNYVFTEREGSLFFFGPGVLTSEKSLFFDLLQNYRVASTNDSGALVYIMLKFGLLGGLFYVAIFVYFLFKDKNKAALFLLLSITKINPFNPLFIMSFILMKKVK